MQELKMGVASAEEETQAVMKVYSKEDYSVVNRFESEFIQNHLYIYSCYISKYYFRLLKYIFSTYSRFTLIFQLK